MNFYVKKVKIEITMPSDCVDNIRETLCNSGAGIIGNYSCCSITYKCIGTFKPNEKANPYIGKANKLEYVDEVKLEVVCMIDIVKDVISKLKEVHPYEEPAINIVPLIEEEDLNEIYSA